MNIDCYVTSFSVTLVFSIELLGFHDADKKIFAIYCSCLNTTAVSFWKTYQYTHFIF